MVSRAENSDLFLVVLLTLSTSALVVFFPEWQSPVRIFLGFFVVLLAPGYILMTLLFPKRDDIDGVERLTLSLGLSIAVIPLLALILNFTPWGIRLVPMAIALSTFILVAGSFAYLRRSRLPPAERYSLPPGGLGFKQSVTGLLGVTAVIGGVVALALALRPPEHFTEFYVLGAEGKLQSYPITLTPGEPFSLTFGIGNREERSQRYIIKFPLAGTIPHLETPMIEAGSYWESSVTLVAPEGDGRMRLPFKLYRPGDTDPFRSLHLYVILASAPLRLSPPTLSPSQVGAVRPSPVGLSASQVIQEAPVTVATLPLLQETPELAAIPTGYTYYAVQPGDTLYGIAKRFFGDGDLFPLIAEANRGVLDNPTVIVAGQRLLIPTVP